MINRRKKRTQSIKPKRAAASAPVKRPASPSTVRVNEYQLSRANKAVINILQEQNIVTNMEPVSRIQVQRVRRELMKQPGNQTLLQRYGFMLYSTQKIHEAIDVYERLVSDFTPSAEDLYFLGCCYLILFDTRQATRVWTLLRESYPESKLVSKIDKNFTRLKELTGEKPKAQKAKSVRQLLRKIESTLDHLGESSVGQDGSDSGECGREVFFFTLDEIGGVGALDTVNSLVEEEPDNIDFLDWAAYVNYTNGNFAKAADYYRKLLELTTANPFAFYYLGEILFRSGKEEKAFAYWDELCEIYGGHQLAEKASRTMALMRMVHR